jgi:hypothetical protein
MKQATCGSLKAYQVLVLLLYFIVYNRKKTERKKGLHQTVQPLSQSVIAAEAAY